MPRRRGRIASLALVAVLVVPMGACGDDAPATTLAAAAPATAEAAVGEWLAAVAAGRAGDATALVVPGQVAFVTALENRLSAADLAAALAGGLPAASGEQYWSSFAASFADFAPGGVGELEVAGSAPFAIDDREFAAVAVGFPDQAGSVGVIAADTAGGWRVDLLATLAPALSGQLRVLATELPADADGEAVRAALVEQLASLRAAAEQPDGQVAAGEVRRELEALIRFLAPALDG